MHTPEQAKELWCPMVRIARREDTHPDEGGAIVVAGCNTDALCGMRVPASCRCIGDRCAMWRWLRSDGGHHRNATHSDDQSVQEMEFSTRIKNCLLAENITTFGQLKKMREAEIMGIPNLGRGSLQEIRSIINQHQESLNLKNTPIVGYCGLAGRPEVF